MQYSRLIRHFLYVAVLYWCCITAIDSSIHRHKRPCSCQSVAAAIVVQESHTARNSSSKSSSIELSGSFQALRPAPPSLRSAAAAATPTATAKSTYPYTESIQLFHLKSFEFKLAVSIHFRVAIAMTLLTYSSPLPITSIQKGSKLTLLLKIWFQINRNYLNLKYSKF